MGPGPIVNADAFLSMPKRQLRLGVVDKASTERAIETNGACSVAADVALDHTHTG